MGIETAIMGSAILGAFSSNKAASTQASAANNAAALQQQQYEQTRQDQMPFLQAGVGAVNQLSGLSSNYQKFGMDQFQQDPGYAFRLSEGSKALDRQAAARGGLISGAALKGAQRYGQEMGSQEYTNAFNRYQTERNAQLNPLQALAGVGQTTAQQLGQAGSSMANNAGDAYQNAANARASGYVGGANAITGGLQNYLNYNQQQTQNAQYQQFLANMNQNNMITPIPPNGRGGYIGGGS